MLFSFFLLFSIVSLCFLIVFFVFFLSGFPVLCPSSLFTPNVFLSERAYRYVVPWLGHCSGLGCTVWVQQMACVYDVGGDITAGSGYHQPSLVLSGCLVHGRRRIFVWSSGAVKQCRRLGGGGMWGRGPRNVCGGRGGKWLPAKGRRRL